MASWNPALMPNTVADSSTEPDAPIGTPVQHDHASKSQSPVESQVSQDAVLADSDPLHHNATQSPVEAVSSRQLPVDHHVRHPSSASSHPKAYSSRQSDVAPAPMFAPINSQPTTGATTSTPPANAAKHASSVSFARTVSHEVNWLDEEDGDWDLGRSDTDPFNKLMPQNDRSNSFPTVVPLAEPQQSEPADRPLAHSQAEEIMNEVVHKRENYPHPPAGAVYREQNQTFVGRDVLPGESRFEEGLPLISQSQSQLNIGSSFDDGDDAAEGDNFFSQVREPEDDQGKAPQSPPLPERKSTMQAMGSISTPKERSNLHEPAAKLSKPTEGQSNGPKEPNEDDLAAKWAMAFADDDDFVLDANKEADPAAFFGGDDEGLLDDDLGMSASPATVPVSAPTQPTTNGRYASASLDLQPSSATGSGTSFVPQPSPSWHPQVPPAYAQQQPVAAQTPCMGVFGVQPPRPDMPKAQSFVDKSKGGYHSPYDLPMEIVKPKKRASAQNLPRAAASPVPAPPLRSSSMGQQGPPQRKDSTSSTSSFGAQVHPLPPLGQKPATKHASFFEELPIASKPRPASRHSLPSPSQTNPYAPPQAPLQGPPHAPPQNLPHGVPSHSTYVPSPLSSLPKDPAVPPMPNLVAPPRTGPYAPVQSSSQPTIPPLASSTTRYSPAPAQGPPTSGAVPPSTTSRYSPAPPGPKAHAPGYMHSAPILPHQPRTSSPLAHFETGGEKPRVPSAPVSGEGASVRSNSSGYGHPVNRIPSLPPTREVDEEVDAPQHAYHQTYSLSSGSSPTESRHPPLPGPPRHTPPPAASQTLSPQKRGSYTPNAPPSNSRDFVPPPRSHTQSPGALYGNRSTSKTSDPVPRPSSVHGPAPPRAVSSYAPMPSQAPQVAPISAQPSRPRGMSQKFDLIPPTDGRENDPLQRWKGCPVFSWGVGGTIVTSFPQPIPRYGGVNSTRPSMVMSPGEVKVKSVKEVQPLEDRLAKFPGPLKGKGKKKETVAWLTAGIESLEKELPSKPFQAHHTHDDKRAVERLLLWKILRIFVEHDGSLEGSQVVDKAVRDVLAPGLGTSEPGLSPAYGNGRNMMALQESAMTRMQSDAVDSSAVEKIRNALLRGDRESAIWAAVDKRLWGHAMLIARTMSQELFMKVAQEFVRKEVNYASHNNESLAALYGVFSGNFEECVDELVPVHARAGLQLMTTSSASNPSKDSTEGLDKWRETLGLILGNRCPGDARALVSLGNLMSGYGRAEASHICYLFARSTAVFGGLDDPTSNFVLVGADHRRQAHQFANETEALLLSEVYEYGLSLAPGSNAAAQMAPHLAAYKLQHAMTLAEYGHRDKALQYCEAIFNSIISQTRKSPYHHPVLESAVEDLMKRLRQAPKEESNSWIPKPSMTKMSDSLFKKFNNFVSGDDNEDSRTGSPTEAVESGPFARVAGGTPTISRSPSVSNFDPYAGSTSQPFQVPMSTSQQVSVPPTRATSRYAPTPGTSSGGPSTSYQPSAAYTPRPSLERSSSEYSRSGYEPNGYATAEPTAAPPHAYVPNGMSQSRQPSFSPTSKTEHCPSSSQYQPVTGPSLDVPASVSYQPLAAQEPNSQPAEQASSFEHPIATSYRAPSYGYEPPSMDTAEPEPSNEMKQDEKDERAEVTATSGYEPPSYGYEPPSYQPYQSEESDEDEDKPRPKKKNIFDEDEDDIPALKRQPDEKTKEEKDKENEELFRKAAEEDAKRAEAAKAQKQSSGWMSRVFGFGAKKEEVPVAVRAKLGETNQFVFDPELNRWVNKKAGAEQTESKLATPPPPRGGITRSVSGTPPPPMNGRASAPPPRSFTPTPSTLGNSPLKDNLQAPPLMMRSASNTSTASLPPRPATSLSNASSIDDLIGPAGPRKGPKKPRKSGRYVDVMAKN